ncbi:uncharacterized protein LOC130442452 [Diorhabda sublineata]|uniref:uncharacterized protein LOC130442452 n=1 Tax=Diorhabda sublineata TaxID=1163346 RepID=UPI0024E1403C|nr:uncharacterized protein LOC130442452 [Diorhabda sublineata]
MCVLRQGFTERYVLIKLVILVSFCLKYGYCDEDNSKRCPREITIVNNSTQVYWNSKGIDNEIVLSSPPCTDKYGNLVTRVCTNNTWIPANSTNLCSKLTRYGKRCPVQFSETSDSCIFFAAAQPWGNICSFEALTEDSNNVPLKNELLWLPYKRLHEYGPFESLTFGENFGIPIKKPIKGALTDVDFFNKNCLVVNTSSEEYYPEFCDRYHRYVCQFSKEEVYARCPHDCVSVDILSDACYCKQKQTCSELAKVNTMYDFTMLSDLADDDESIVGTITYPDLPFYEFNQSLSEHSWYYTKKNLSYSLCVTQHPKQNSVEEAQLTLNFDDKERKLYLTIYSPEGLFENANEKTIYCFTNAAPYAIKTRKDVEQIIENRENVRSYNVYEVELEDKIGIYYCEVFKSTYYVDDKIESNPVLAYKTKSGTEFSARLIISNVCQLFNCNQTNLIDFRRILNKSLNFFKEETRVMDIYNFDLKSVDILIHISNEDTNDVLEDFKYIKDNLENREDINVIYIRSSEYCLPETLHNLSWPLTPISQSAVSDQNCLQQNGLPVIRICGGDFLTGAEWGDVIGECSSDVELPESTKYIYSALQQNLTTETVNNVTNVIENDPNLPVLSIYYASKFLNKIFDDINSNILVDTTNNENNSVDSTMKIIDNLLNVNKELLVSSQDLLNVTDDLIDVVENILIETTSNLTAFLLQEQNVIVHVTNPISSDIYGVVIYQEQGKEPIVADLHSNSSLYDLGPNALFALLIPEEILNHKNSSNITIITTIYFKDAFFESNHTTRPSGPVVSVTIPEFGGYLPSSIPIMFKESNYSEIPECGFWDYGKKTVRKKGHWSTSGGVYMGEFDIENHYHICMYSHLTHLSMLRITMEKFLSSTDDVILDVIAIIGDIMTLIGITGIFLTAFLFKIWRRKQGTIILLNLSISILLETFIMQISDSKFFVTVHSCTILGILLHYFVISKFCWMLVYSFLQYMRFVKVLTILPENIVLKSIIFGWGFAILPVGIVNIINSTTYTKRKYNYCYPVGANLYYGVLLPVSIIVFVNTFVFFAVMRRITSNTVESHGSKENIQKLQIQLACLLFFVLGVPWMFWVFANFIYIQWLKLTLIYLFAVTSNIQGFILFLFYVILNNETKAAWAKYFRKNRPKSFSSSIKTSSKSN